MKMTPLRLLLPLVPLALVGVTSVTHANAPAGRYQIVTPGTVYDTKTKLTWQHPSADAGAWSPLAGGWSQAISGCTGGWRLPTANELLTLIDFSQATAPVIDRAFFPGTPATFPAFFWSSDLVNGSASALVISFANGASGAIPKSNTSTYARCVR